MIQYCSVVISSAASTPLPSSLVRDVSAQEQSRNTIAKRRILVVYIKLHFHISWHITTSVANNCQVFSITHS